MKPKTLPLTEATWEEDQITAFFGRKHLSQLAAYPHSQAPLSPRGLEKRLDCACAMLLCNKCSNAILEQCHVSKKVFLLLC